MAGLATELDGGSFWASDGAGGLKKRWSRMKMADIKLSLLGLATRVGWSADCWTSSSGCLALRDHSRRRIISHGRVNMRLEGRSAWYR